MEHQDLHHYEGPECFRCGNPVKEESLCGMTLCYQCQCEEAEYLYDSTREPSE